MASHQDVLQDRPARGAHAQAQPDHPLGSQLLELSAEELVSTKTLAPVPLRPRPITPYRHLPASLPYLLATYRGPIETFFWAFPLPDPAPPTAVHPDHLSCLSSVWTSSAPPTVQSTPQSSVLPPSGPSGFGQERLRMERYVPPIRHCNLTELT